jgi:hypothetical protein
MTQCRAILRLRKNNTSAHVTGNRFFEFCRRRYLRWRNSPGLLCGLTSNPLPSLHSLSCSMNKMRVTALRDDRYDSAGAEFRAFLNRPFKTVELEYCKQYCYRSCLCCLHHFTEFKFDPVFTDATDATPPNRLPSRYIELLPDLTAQNARKVSGVLAGQRSPISIHFIGDPASSRHRQDRNNSSAVAIPITA